ncbi:bacteriocin immunity protein [Vagococcus sp.]|uniref:bacteriocin immunity protein n=1 Tax=Vagococcus sp. TaxID=1933889 RepID=UPI002FCBE027
MKTSKEDEILTDIVSILKETISEKEREILLSSKKELDNHSYFPKIISTLEKQLTPLAVSSKLSKPLAPFYLKITSHRFKYKNFGGGLITAFGVAR